MNDSPGSEVTSADRIISIVLRSGVGLSFVFIVCGLFYALFAQTSHLGADTSLTEILDPAASIRSFRELVTAVGQRRPDGIIMLGLLILIATPIFRVAASILIFIDQRSAAFVAITTFVLALLLGSIFLGRAGG